MKPLILSTATILTASLIYSFPALTQSQRITCVRDHNVITCPNYGSFRYSSNNNNRSRANISCFRDQNVINCQNYGREPRIKDFVNKMLVKENYLTYSHRENSCKELKMCFVTQYFLA